MVRAHPNQVMIYEGGPMTNLVLALKLTPDEKDSLVAYMLAL